MAKAIAIVASALCVLAAITTTAYGEVKPFTIKGEVYCDTCRVFFQTKLSEIISGARVELVCRNRDNNTETYRASATTGGDGSYTMHVEGDHEADICAVSVVESNKADCAEVAEEINSVKVMLAENSGMETPFRYANPIGFVRTNPLAGCGPVLKELGFVGLQLADDDDN